jgi:hypothetical protein
MLRCTDIQFTLVPCCRYSCERYLGSCINENVGVNENSCCINENEGINENGLIGDTLMIVDILML